MHRIGKGHELRRRRRCHARRADDWRQWRCTAARGIIARPRDPDARNSRGVRCAPMCTASLSVTCTCSIEWFSGKSAKDDDRVSAFADEVSGWHYNQRARRSSFSPRPGQRYACAIETLPAALNSLLARRTAWSSATPVPPGIITSDTTRSTAATELRYMIAVVMFGVLCSSKPNRSSAPCVYFGDSALSVWH